MIREVSLLTGIKEEKLETLVDAFGWVEIMSNTKLIEKSITGLQLRKFKTVFNLSKDLSVARFLREQKTLDSSSDAEKLCREILKHEGKERLIAIFTDGQHNVLGWEEIAKGTVNECVVYPREVVEKALRYNATCVILAHNHPADSMKFSRADRDVTKKIKTALEHIEINLLDHIVVGKSGATISMAERGEM